MFYPVPMKKASEHSIFYLPLRRILLPAILSLIFFAGASQANENKQGELTKVYKVVAEDGSVSFSDQPDEKSETVMVAPVPTVPAITPDKNIFTPKAVESDKAPSRYSSLSILAPANDSAFYSGSGEVNVLLDIKPALIEGDQIQLFVDGKLIKSANQIQARLETIERGTHELLVKLVTSSGQVEKQARSTFTVHRTSIRN